MTVDDVRFRARRELEQVGVSMESAAYLADDRPPGGWDSLATKDALSSLATKDELRVFAAELRTEMAQLSAALRQEMRDQTRWLTGVLVVSITFVATFAAAIGGAIVRFT